MATRKKPSKRAPHPRAALKAKPKPKAVEPRAPTSTTLPFDIDPQAVEASLKRLGDQVVKLAKKGRYTKVRFKFRGKQLLPDIPLAAVAAVEGLSFYWTGLLRLLVVNLAGRTVLDVELVNDSEKHLQLGKEALLRGDLDDALKAFHTALDMDHDNPVVHLNVGIALKLSGDRDGARRALARAQQLDPDGATGAEAARLLTALSPPIPGAIP